MSQKFYIIVGCITVKYNTVHCSTLQYITLQYSNTITSLDASLPVYVYPPLPDSPACLLSPVSSLQSCLQSSSSMTLPHSRIRSWYIIWIYVKYFFHTCIIWNICNYSCVSIITVNTLLSSYTFLFKQKLQWIHPWAPTRSLLNVPHSSRYALK